MTEKENWKTWLETKAQPHPRYFKSIKERKGYKATYLKPEDMIAFLNASSPRELNKPDYTPIQMDYPTSAFNYKNFLNPEKEPFTVMASEPSWKYALMNMLQTAQEYPKDYPRQYVPQGVYEHELGHYQDPRINPYKMWSYPNRGYTTFAGLSGGLLQREMPAMKAEDMFWYRLMKALRSKR